MGILVGDSLHLVLETRAFSQRFGDSIVRIWEGTYGSCQDLAIQLQGVGQAQDVQVTMRADGTATTTAYFADVEGEETTKLFRWEFPPTVRTLDLYQHPRSTGLTENDLNAVKYNVKLFQTGDATTARRTYSAGGNADAVRLYKRIIYGGTHYLESTYSLKLTEVVSPLYAVQISDIGVEQIYTSDQIYDEAIANGTPLPDRYLYKLEQIEANPKEVGQGYLDDGGSASDYAFGWLKFASTERENGDSKIEIETHWTLALWSTYEYTEYSP